MASIKAKLSAVELYTSQCGDDYSTILNIARDILSRSETRLVFVRGELEKINRQHYRAQGSRDDIAYKFKLYHKKMRSAFEESERWSREIEHIYNNPITKTTTDDEGNEITEKVVDYDAVYAAQREKEAAQSTYYLYERKCQDAEPVLREAEYVVRKIQGMERVMETISLDIQNYIYEIEKYIRAIEDEAEFNIRSLRGVIDSLQSYLASKAIYMPVGTRYEELASASIAASGLTSSDQEANSKEKSWFSFNIKKKKSSKENNLLEKLINRNLYSEFNQLVASKKTIQLTETWEDRLDSETIFEGVNGGHWGNIQNVVLKEQGKNSYNEVAFRSKSKLGKTFSGTCGLASLANVLRLLGDRSVSEDDMVQLAYDNNLCRKPLFNKKGFLVRTGGGTTDPNVVDLAKLNGLEAAVSPNLSLEDIDNVLQRGGAVMMSVVSKDLVSAKKRRKLENTDHWVTVLGIKKNKYSGAIEGVYIQDTGGFSYNEVLIDAEKFDYMRNNSNGFSGVCFFKKEEV